MSDSEFEALVFEAVMMLRLRAPIDTGNLAYNAIKVDRTGPNEWTIWVDESIAPYMPYTNEPWISAKWHGKQNPNEDWWDEAVRFISGYLAEKVNAELREE